MTIHTIYRVEIELDSATYIRIVESRKEPEFDREFIAACTHLDFGAQDSSGGLTLWAETRDQAQACRCDAALIALVAKWKAWAKLPQEE